MLPIVHTPMIVRLVERLAAGGVTDVVLALGFKPEPFRDAFPDGRHGDVRVHYVVEPEPLDTAGAIAFAAREVGVDDTFVVANGDIITDLDVAWLVAAHRSTGSEATIHLTPVADPSAFGVVEIDADGVVRRFVEKPAPGETESNLINAGTYVLEPSVLELIEPGKQGVDRTRHVPASRRSWPVGRCRDRRLLDRRRASRSRTSAPISISPLVGSAVVTRLRSPPRRRSIRRRRASRASSATAQRSPPERRSPASVILPGAVVGERATVVDSIIAGEIGVGADVSRQRDRCRVPRARGRLARRCSAASEPEHVTRRRARQ